MTKSHEPGRVLVRHFFRRFFDSDTIQIEGETLTTVIRAVSAVAVPGLMVAFFLQNSYPKRSLWGAIEDQYFFVLFSFVVMGGAAVIEWEMLFPDRLDFLILSPLPVKPRTMLAAKAGALAAFLCVFLLSANILGAIVLPVISHGNIPRQMYAHTVAVLLAGIFASLFFLALGGVLLCILGARRFRALSPLIQMLSVTMLLLLLVHYWNVGDSMEWLLHEPMGLTRWLPSLWFLGVYEALLRGASAPPFAWPMARLAVRGTLILAAIVAVTYPLAWAGMRRMAIEGASLPRKQPARWWQWMTRRLVRRPGERAAFHFIGQTIVRHTRYQAYLAMYGGVGLALAAAYAFSLKRQGLGIEVTLSNQGLHAIMPLLLFWVIAGLRTAFAFPTDLAAGWVFRTTGASVLECAAAARLWTLGLSVTVAGLILIILRWAGWSVHDLLVQLVCGLALCILLTDAFFFFARSVPFNQPRMPGRTSFPLLLTLYVGVFPLYISGVVHLERKWEVHPVRLFSLGAAAVLIHLGVRFFQDAPVEVEEEMEGYDGEFQLLGLSFE